MKTKYLSIFSVVITTLFFSACSSSHPKESSTSNEKVESTNIQTESTGPVLVIHGGAGYMKRENYSDQQVQLYKMALKNALESAYSILESGGSSAEAVVKAIQILESDSLFNAGIGAVLTHERTVSLDASFMDGKTGEAGAVSGISKVKSPIELAQKIMNSSNHVMLSGTGAEKFATQEELEIVTPSYFITQTRMNQINTILEQERKELSTENANIDPYLQTIKMGTVGAVALDKDGNLASGTSTGGMTNKKHGRIGDSPIIGAGTFADNATCAVSATGHGEFFIRNVVAYDVAARMKYKKSTLKEAAQASIDHLTTINGDGGIIALDKQGNIAMPFNTSGMFRAYAKPNEEVYIEMFD